ncbi:MAG: hypothetical protein ACN0LA_09940 [Candidatus Longimicrobiales bacterium M2_2A_002]
MTEKEFREAVAQLAHPSLESSALEAAISHYVKEGNLYNGDVSRCIELAGTIASLRAPSSGDDDGSPQPARLPGTPLAEAWGRQLLDQCQPWIEQEVASITGRTSWPPWPADPGAAAAWIEANVPEARARVRAGDRYRRSAEYRERFAAALGSLNELADETGDGLTVKRRWRYLRYAAPDDSGHFPSGWRPEGVRVPWRGDDALTRLARMQEQLSGATGASRNDRGAAGGLGGFFPVDLLTYALTGIEPPFHRATVLFGAPPISDTLRGPHAPSKRVAVTFYTPDVTNDDLRKLRRQIRESWRRMGVEAADDESGPLGPRLTETDQERLNAIEKLGGVSEDVGPDFWVALQEHLGDSAPDDPDSLRRWWKRYKRKANKIPAPYQEENDGEA